MQYSGKGKMYPESNPVVKAELEPIDVAIRKERASLWDLEDAGHEPRSTYLEYLCREKARGVEPIVINF